MSEPLASFTVRPRGPFELANQNAHFNPWPELASEPGTVAMAMPVEGWKGSVAVTLREIADGSLAGAVHGDGDAARAKAMALAAMSLDEDGSGWAAIGEKDPRIGEIQRFYRYLRPSLFQSPYEAAAALVIGHRITIDQTRRLRAAIAVEHGAAIDVGGEILHAFPGPREILALSSVRSLGTLKVERLHGVARAALDGILDRAHLRALAEAEALAELQTIPGIGPFFSVGILYRGAGLADGLLEDEFTRQIVRTAYDLPADSGEEGFRRVTDAWRPYRSWATVLLHARMRETGRFPSRRPGGPSR